MIQIVEDAVEDGKVERLVRLLASVGYPADHVRLQNGHIALDGVLVQDGQGRLGQIARPLRRRILRREEEILM